MKSIMTFRAVVFDLDGTLLDTLGDIAGSANEALALAGHPAHPIEAYRIMVGDGLVNLARKVLPEGYRDEKSIQSFVSTYRRLYSERWRATSKPFPGIPELLDRLQALGIPLAVLSNKRDDFTALCVRELLSSWRFSVVRGERAGVPLKPDPQSALEVAREMGIAPENCLYVGDSEIDVETAQRAGMGCVGVLWGFRSEKDLRHAGAEELIEHPMELIEYVAST